MDNILSCVINLPDRTDRRIEMEHQLRRSELNAEFFPAIRPTEAAGFPSVGARGCFLSHLAVLKQGSLERRHVMIMEDDLDFVADFRNRWNSIVPVLETLRWSIFYPAHLLEDIPDGMSELPPEIGVLCTHFVLFHRDAVPSIVSGLEEILDRPPGHPDGGPMHVDGAYSTLRYQRPRLNTLVYSPALGRQRSSRSDIADQRFYDRLTVLRSGAKMFRGLKKSMGL